MFDDVHNRSRLTFWRKVRIGCTLIRESGVSYFLVQLAYFASAWLATRALNMLASMRETRGVSGINSRLLNRQIWDNWNWDAKGDEWTLSPEWKESIVRSILRPNIPAAVDVLEIGPGAGRWTEHLIPGARSYVGVDISAECVRICQARFCNTGAARFVCNSGADLIALGDRSIDRIWSFDSFVHINRAEAAAYVKEMRRVMRPGALAVIHHGDGGGRSGGWRSDLTSDAFVGLLGASGLRVENQVSHWVDTSTSERHALAYDDKITIFRMPA